MTSTINMYIGTNLSIMLMIYYNDLLFKKFYQSLNKRIYLFASYMNVCPRKRLFLYKSSF